MALLSIPSYKSDDPNYRYKMPKLVAKVEGRGNGIRTNIVNMSDIARALKRPADYPTKFCGHELGAQSKFDPAEGKAIVNGAHDQRLLQSLIDKFIDKFVLCQKCNLPEIDLQLKKDLVVYHCNACGASGEADNSHKLATFILKNPPDGGNSTLGTKSTKKTKDEKHKEKVPKEKVVDDACCAEEKSEKKKKDKEGGKEKKEKKSSTSSSSTKKSTSKKAEDNEGVESGESDKKHKKSSKSKSDKTRKQNGVAAAAAAADEGDDDDEEELTFTSVQTLAVISTLVEFVSVKQKNPQEKDEAKNDDEKNKRKKVFDESLTSADFFEALRSHQISRAFNDRLKIFIALGVLFSSDFGGLTVGLLESRAKYLILVCDDCKNSVVLSVLEEFIHSPPATSSVPDGFKNFPYFVQKLYSADILSDDGILSYYQSKRRAADARESYVKAKEAVQPFVQWLQQAESESDDSSAGEQAAAGPQLSSKSGRSTASSSKAGSTSSTSAAAAAARQGKDKATDVSSSANLAANVDAGDSDVELDDL